MLKLSSSQQIHSLHIVLPGQPQRANLEHFIRHHYARVYQADLRHFMPLLLGLYDANGQPFAALGLRPADTEALYLEQYLDQPIENTLAKTVRQPLARSHIVELGHFAVARPEAAMWMILLSTAYLHASGAKWACATLIPTLAKALHRLGLEPWHIAPVDACRLSDTENQWGCYYQQQPHIFADKVEDSFQRIQTHLQGTLYWQKGLERLWDHAYQAGMAA